MTDVDATAVPPAEAPADPWLSYLAAAQGLDAVRRTAASDVAAQTQAVEAARAELIGVQARLAPQLSRLTDLGVPAAELTPAPAEVSAAAAAVAGGPVPVIAALRQARATADAADAALVAAAPSGFRATWTPWLRNLLVYGPYALVVLLVQIALYLVAAPDSLPVLALACGLTMPLAAFGLGWLTIGFVFPPGPSGARADRTPFVGAVVCFAPIVVTCMGVGLLSLLN